VTRRCDACRGPRKPGTWVLCRACGRSYRRAVTRATTAEDLRAWSLRRARVGVRLRAARGRRGRGR
jgi:hypothetical protein